MFRKLYKRSRSSPTKPTVSQKSSFANCGIPSCTSTMKYFTLVLLAACFATLLGPDLVAAGNYRQDYWGVQYQNKVHRPRDYISRPDPNTRRPIYHSNSRPFPASLYSSPGKMYWRYETHGPGFSVYRSQDEPVPVKNGHPQNNKRRY